MEIKRENTNTDLTDVAVTEYQFSGMSGSNPLFLAYFSRNFLLF
jgi:hypothetical protein